MYYQNNIRFYNFC